MDEQTVVTDAGAASAEVKPETLMDRLLKASPVQKEPGELIEGTVIGKRRMELFVDLKPFGTGIIYGREYLNARDIINKVNIGDTISAKVVGRDHKDGYIELSLREARQAAIWKEIEEAIKNKTTLDLAIKDANKGGLIIEWQGVDGFLPASQLKPEHYPRIDDGDKDKIHTELKSLVGQKLTVTIIGADQKEGKLIFSEKGQFQKERHSLLEKYKIGDVVEGDVTGAVDFGVFVKVEDGLEGLVHISEMDWSLVENPRSMYKVGDKVKVKVIEIKDDKVSLSIKALKDNPWNNAADKYAAGQQVKGVVIKFNKHGALVSIEEGVAGLVHISEFGGEDKLRDKLELGKTYAFKIATFEPKDQRMTLTFAEGK